MSLLPVLVIFIACTAGALALGLPLIGLRRWQLRRRGIHVSRSGMLEAALGLGFALAISGLLCVLMTAPWTHPAWLAERLTTPWLRMLALFGLLFGPSLIGRFARFVASAWQGRQP